MCDNSMNIYRNKDRNYQTEIELIQILGFNLRNSSKGLVDYDLRDTTHP